MAGATVVGATAGATVGATLVGATVVGAPPVLRDSWDRGSKGWWLVAGVGVDSAR